MKYKEIQALHEFCLEHKIKHYFHTFNDDWGYQISFINGDDCIQHKYSYDNKDHIEFMVHDSEPPCGILVLTLNEAKDFVLRHYKRGK